MFKLHDKTRRITTLLIFLTFGPVLLTLVLTWVVLRRSSLTVAGWETVLTNLVDKRVEIEKVTFPAPGVTRFQQCRIIDPETGATLVYIPYWELVDVLGEIPVSDGQVTQSNNVLQNDQSAQNSQVPQGHQDGLDHPANQGNQNHTPYKRGFWASIRYTCSTLSGSQKRYWRCDIPTLSCFETSIAEAKTALNRLMAQSPSTRSLSGNRERHGTDVRPAVLLIGQLDLFFANRNRPDSVAVWESSIASVNGGKKSAETSGQGQLEYATFKNLQCEFRPDTEKSTLTVAFQLAGNQANSTPLNLEVVRERQTTLCTVVRFATQETLVPVTLLSRFDPFFNGFGEHAHFQGNVVTRANTDWSQPREQTFELRNASFCNVSLEAFLGNHFPFPVSGHLERLDVTSALFNRETRSGTSPSRLVRAEGIVKNGQGMVDWPGLYRLAYGTQLQVSPPGNTQPPETDVTFRQCNFTFVIDVSGIRLIPMLTSQPYRQPLPLLVIDNQCAIYWPAPGHYIRYADFLAALSRPTSTLVPLMPETESLMTFLPLTPTQRVFRKTNASIAKREQPAPQPFQQTFQQVPQQAPQQVLRPQQRQPGNTISNPAYTGTF